ncbi:methyltransferase, FxLD system [Dactylosporangium sp. NPDC005572]|uniref:methyltransferase, FxLD system n=1 Tax=Dactylosporangium sp. NPDC005572 TaxID=3156889 RepID=UPI0033AEBF22
MILFPDRDTTHQAAVQAIAPALEAAHTAGHLHDWWFLNKEPWLLRCRGHQPVISGIDQILDGLRRAGQLTRWSLGIYEPETHAFGGPPAMDATHRLFHADSRYRTTQTTRTAQPAGQPAALGPRETFVIAAGVLCRAAGLDQFEQGDVWHQVAELRPEPPAAILARTGELAAKVHRLVACHAPATLAADLAQPHTAGAWLDALTDTGRALAQLHHQGQLLRGLRAVLAHHLLFLANRAGLSLTDQASLAHLAVHVAFHTEPSTPTLRKVPPVALHTDHTDRAGHSELSADQLRRDLVDRLERNGTARSQRVIAALRAVRRELFVPQVPVEKAYADDAVYTKNNVDGVAISAASQPTIVATMLEQLDLHPGHKVFEAGAGTGYNAALMAAIVGDNGHVTAVDVDDDIVGVARAHLAMSGVTNVEVVLGDGALGHAPSAPYQRAIATVGAYQIPDAWLNQLAPGGRLLVPLRLRGTTTRCIAFERDADGWYAVNSEIAVFMPLRGIGDDSDQRIYLTDDHTIQLQVHQDQTADPAALTGVIATKRHERWTGVLFPPDEPLAWMDLWLACTLDNALMRMNVQPPAVERCLVTPSFGWGSMATVRGADLAYLTIRPARPTPDRGKLYEVGVIGHGPAGDTLADETADQIRHWDTHYRTKTVAFTLPTALPDPDPAIGRFVLPRRQNSIVVAWT